MIELLKWAYQSRTVWVSTATAAIAFLLIRFAGWLGLTADQALAVAGTVVALAVAIIGKLAAQNVAGQIVAGPENTGDPPAKPLSKIPPAVLFLPLLLVLGAGCASTAAYRMEAASAIGNSLTQLNTALDESADSIHLRIQAERDALWAAYQSDLSALVAKKLSDAEAAAELVRLAKKYQDKQAIIDQSRVEVDRRFALATEHARFAQETLAQMYTFENDNLTMQAQLERYRALATDYARKKFGLDATVVPPLVAPTPSVQP